MKPGVLTSEFWLSVLVVVCGTIMLGLNKIDATIWITALGIPTAAYNVSRGIAKINPPKD